MKITTVGIDLAKALFQVHGADAQGRVLLKRKLARSMPRGDQAGTGPTIRMTDKAGVATRGGRSPTGVTTLATARS